MKMQQWGWVAEAGFSANIYTPQVNQLKHHSCSYPKSKGTARSLCSFIVVSFPIIVLLQCQLM